MLVMARPIYCAKGWNKHKKGVPCGFQSGIDDMFHNIAFLKYKVHLFTFFIV
jgi:hypothetical protein